MSNHSHPMCSTCERILERINVTDLAHVNLSAVERTRSD